MKKIITLLIIFCITQYVIAQTSVSDTAQYLRDSISTKANYYTGKPLGTLLNELKLGVRYYISEAPLPSSPDPISFNRITFYFVPLNDVILNPLKNKKNPHIVVRFSSMIQVPKAYLKKGGLLDWTTDWTPVKANFFSQYIIAGLNVGGID